MITRITKANADKYRVLFSDAVNALKTHDSSGNPIGSIGAGEPVIPFESEYQEVKLDENSFVGGDYYIKIADDQWELTAEDAEFDSNAVYAILIDSSESISTLEEYFHYIAELQAINNRYTILPLDEDFFFINANTRLIEVPKSFKDAGIAVQGDEVAEILYFKINRYFDMDDLATKDILIQWRAPADKEGKRQEGLSKPWVVDIVSEPGYIIFGWPLSSELTAFPGKIDFAVRFYTYNEDEEKIVYSLSTLTSTAEIKEGLNYDLETILLDGAGVIDSSDLIINRLVSSELNDESAPEAEKPEIIDNIIECYGYEEIKDEDEVQTYYKVYLTNSNTGEELDGKYTIQAKTSDTGNISYTWIKRDTEGNLIQDTIAEGSGIRFIEVNDEVKDDNKIYYQKQTDDIYTIFNFSDECPDLEAAVAAGIQLYERVSSVVINTGNNALGSYQARVTNRVGRKIARTYSNIVLVEGPESPKITKELDEFSNGILEFDSENNTYSTVLKAEVEKDVHAYTTYRFQKQIKIEGTEEIDYTDIHVSNTNPEYTLIGAAYGAEGGNGDGLYRLVVESKLNSSEETATSEDFRVTHAASPVSITVSESNLPDNGYNINSNISVEIKLNENEQRVEGLDDVIYQWYKYNGTNEELINDIEAAKNGLYEVKENSDIILEGANSASIKIANTEANESGYYFCEVTNIYNGTTATKCSSFFNVIDTKRA